MRHGALRTEAAVELNVGGGTHTSFTYRPRVEKLSGNEQSGHAAKQQTGRLKDTAVHRVLVCIQRRFARIVSFGRWK
jgi:hypothetical protein